MLSGLGKNKVAVSFCLKIDMAVRRSVVILHSHKVFFFFGDDNNLTSERIQTSFGVVC